MAGEMGSGVKAKMGFVNSQEISLFDPHEARNSAKLLKVAGTLKRCRFKTCDCKTRWNKDLRF